MSPSEMNAEQISGYLSLIFDWDRRPHEGKYLQAALELLKKQDGILRMLRSTMNDMMRGNVSEEIAYLLKMMDQLEGKNKNAAR